MGFITVLISALFFALGFFSEPNGGINTQLLIASGLFMIASAIFSKE